MNRAIILAAGMGTRLVSGEDFPKPMKKVAGVPLIVRILRNLERAGITDVAIIVGYKHEVIREGLRGYRFRMNVEFVQNDEYEKPNGTSLLKAKDFVKGPTFVLMSDHLWSPELFQAVQRYPLAVDEAAVGTGVHEERGIREPGRDRDPTGSPGLGRGACDEDQAEQRSAHAQPSSESAGCSPCFFASRCRYFRSISAARAAAEMFPPCRSSSHAT